jgi:hypothetical protein
MTELIISFFSSVPISSALEPKMSANASRLCCPIKGAGNRYGQCLPPAPERRRTTTWSAFMSEKSLITRLISGALTAINPTAGR